MTLISTILDWLRGRIADVELWLWRRRLRKFMPGIGDVDGDRYPELMAAFGRNQRPSIDRYARGVRRER